MTGTNASEPAVAVVGAGAVGGLVAAFLQRAGHDVVLVGRAATARHVAEHGLRVVTDDYGSWHAPLRATTTVPVGAAVLVAVKAEGIAAVAPQVAAASPAEVMPLLNGVEHMDVLRAALGDDAGAVLRGASYAGETLRTAEGADAPMTIRHRGRLLRVTVPDDATGTRLGRALAGTEIPVTTGGSQEQVLWSKLRFLAPHALLTSAHRSGIGEALDADPARTAALLAEVAAVATAEGVATSADDLDAILRGFHPTMRSSLQADLAAGRPGELDAIGGAVARRGARHGIPTPTLDRLVAGLTPR